MFFQHAHKIQCFSIFFIHSFIQEKFMIPFLKKMKKKSRKEFFFGKNFIKCLETPKKIKKLIFYFEPWCKSIKLNYETTIYEHLENTKKFYFCKIYGWGTLGEDFGVTLLDEKGDQIRFEKRGYFKSFS